MSAAGRRGLHEPGLDGKIHEYCSAFAARRRLSGRRVRCGSRRRMSSSCIRHSQYGRNHEQYYEDAMRAYVIFLCYAADQPPGPQKPGFRRRASRSRQYRLTFGEELKYPLTWSCCHRHGAAKSRSDHRSVEAVPDEGFQEVHPASTGRSRRQRVFRPEHPGRWISRELFQRSRRPSRRRLLSAGISADPFRACRSGRCRGEGKCVGA